MTRVRCGWCGKEFSMDVVKEKHGYGTRNCPYCGRLVRSSKKEQVEGVTARRKHIHMDLKPGDVV